MNTSTPPTRGRYAGADVELKDMDARNTPLSIPETRREGPDPSSERECGPEEIKALLNRWERESFFRVKGWGDRVKVLSVRPIPSYVLTLETQYERRTTETRREPCEPGLMDLRGTPPGLWEVKVPPPHDFTSGMIESAPVPHTDRVVRCEGCRGLGRLDCPACGGTGRLRRGDRAGGGCPNCDSRGWSEHGACAGKGHFREYQAVVSTFTCKTAEERLFSFPLPKRLLKESGRETLIDYRRKGGGFAPPDAHPEMGPGLESLWEQSVPEGPETMRILFQRYRVERLKGWEVAYETPGASAPGKLWITGERQVFAP